MSHDNWSKNHLIVLKFSTDVAFIYHQIEFVAQKNRSITSSFVDSDKIIFARSRISEKASKNVRYKTFRVGSKLEMKYFRILVFQRIFDKSTQNFNHLSHLLKTNLVKISINFLFVFKKKICYEKL